MADVLKIIACILDGLCKYAAIDTDYTFFPGSSVWFHFEFFATKYYFISSVSPITEKAGLTLVQSAPTDHDQHSRPELRTKPRGPGVRIGSYVPEADWLKSRLLNKIPHKLQTYQRTNLLFHFLMGYRAGAALVRNLYMKRKYQGFRCGNVLWSVLR